MHPVAALVHRAATMRRVGLAVALTVQLATVAFPAGEGLAQTSSAVPRAPANVVAAKAYATLERGCARCHQAGRLDGRQPAAGIANILALDEVARNPALVRPGMPDASRIYNIALTRELHHDVFNDPAVAEPSSLEVQALRDWITELAPRAGGACTAREQVSAAKVGAAVDAAIAALPSERARQTRFLSLAHLHNACLSDAELEGLRGAVRALLDLLAPKGAATAAGSGDAIDGTRLVYSISLTALGWRAEQWDKLVAGYPLRAMQAKATPPSVSAATGTPVSIVHADWFAHAVQQALSGAFDRDDAAGKAPTLWGLSGPLGLAQAWRRPADIERAAAELDMPPALLRAWLAGVTGDPGLAAQQLRAGDVAQRLALDKLYVLTGQSNALVVVGAAAERFEIAIVPDKPVYNAGDTATFSVQASRDCYLTLVGVDRGGRATVLFPSEIEPVNRISGGKLVRVPGEAAPYRFRFKDKGRETIVAICSQTHPSPEGVVHDYDRLRFTVLGDWQLFLREPPEMKQARRDDAATDIPRPLVRQRRRGRGTESKADSAAGHDVQTRTAITIEIE